MQNLVEKCCSQLLFKTVLHSHYQTTAIFQEEFQAIAFAANRRNVLLHILVGRSYRISWLLLRHEYMPVVSDCQEQFNFVLPSVQLARRA